VIKTRLQVHGHPAASGSPGKGLFSGALLNSPSYVKKENSVGLKIRGKGRTYVGFFFWGWGGGGL